MTRPKDPRRFPAVRNGARGFSLLELMVAIAVVAALTALIWPGYNALVRRSDQVTCASNLRQVGVAMHAYAHDRSGWLPGLSSGSQRAHYRQSTLNAPSALVDFLQPYLGLPASTSQTWTTAPSFVCPASRKSINPQGTSLNDNAYYTHVGTVLPSGAIQRPLGYLGKSVPTPPMKLETVEHLIKTIALVDRDLEAVYGKPQAHGSTYNILFMDGHIAAIAHKNFVLRKDSTFEVIY